MDTPSDSDRSRRERRKTPYEIFFEEEPVFSDSEDEAEFMRLNFGPSLEFCKDKSDKSVSKYNGREISDTLPEDILKVCCGSCNCCRKVKDLIYHSQKTEALTCSPSLSSSNDSGFGSRGCSVPAKRQKVHNEKITSKKINIISNHTIPGTQSASKDIPVEPKMLQSSSTNRIKKKRAVEKETRKKIPRLCKDVDKRSKNNGDCNADNFDRLLEKDLGSRRTLGCIMQGTKPTNMALAKGQYTSQKLNFDTNTELHQGNGESSQHITNSRNSRPTKRRPKASRKSMPNFRNSVSSRDSSPEYQSRSLVVTAAFEPRILSRKRKPCKQYNAEAALNGLQLKRKSNRHEKTFAYGMIDKRIFKIPIDTTMDRGFAKTLARKLARRGGIDMNMESFSKDHESFRSSPAPKIKKLYSPEKWLDSQVFSEICELDK